MSKTKRTKQRIWIIFGFIILISLGSLYQPEGQPTQNATQESVEKLFEQQQDNRQVEVSGTISELLPDDNKGSRHQRFIITLPSGHTLLIVHNIDLAPRVEELTVGDEVRIYGEYVWNNKGGLIHWTHHDPDNQHPHGWIRHQERLYQ